MQFLSRLAGPPTPKGGVCCRGFQFSQYTMPWFRTANRLVERAEVQKSHALIGSVTGRMLLPLRELG